MAKPMPAPGEGAPFESAQSPKPSTNLFSNGYYLKRFRNGGDDAIPVKDSEHLRAEGVWVPESNDPKKALVFP